MKTIHFKDYGQDLLIMKAENGKITDCNWHKSIYVGKPIDMKALDEKRLIIEGVEFTGLKIERVINQ